ncbi:MAG: multiheme c-type cytochrome [Coriobacteriia bacterium]
MAVWRARSVLALVGAVLLVSLAAASAEAVPSIPSSAFEPVRNCGCHSSFQETWSRSMHAQALSDPIYQYELGLAIKATDGALGPFCNSCHGPVAVMSGEIDGLDLGGLSDAARDAISCDFCHQVTGRVGDKPGNASYALDDPDGTKRAQLKDAKSPYHVTAYSEFHETAEFCGNCHDVFHPINGLPLEQTYTEWKNGPYAAEGIVCQDCHMTPGPGVTKPNPGRAAPFGVDRDHIYIMTFAGGNTALGDAALAEERLKAAAQVLVDVPVYVEPGATAEVTVTVTNVGAGHYIPTGLTEFRQMWLEVTLASDEGTQTIGEHRYGLELGDDEGNHPVPLWEATNIAKDDRIPPRESRTYTYEFTMPESGVADIRAALYYRSVSEEVAHEAGVDVPTTLMADAGGRVFGSEEIAAEIAQESAGHLTFPGGSFALWAALVAIVAIVGVVGAAIVRNRKM